MEQASVFSHRTRYDPQAHTDQADMSSADGASIPSVFKEPDLILKRPQTSEFKQTCPLQMEQAASIDFSKNLT
jgi:hypothetical protein